MELFNQWVLLTGLWVGFTTIIMLTYDLIRIEYRRMKKKHLKKQTDKQVKCLQEQSRVNKMEFYKAINHLDSRIETVQSSIEELQGEIAKW